MHIPINHHQNQDNKYIHHPQELPPLPLWSFLPPVTLIPGQLLICFLSLYVSFHLLEFYINGITRYI